MPGTNFSVRSVPMTGTEALFDTLCNLADPEVVAAIEALIRDGEDQHLCCVNVLTFDPRHTLSPAPLNPLGERYYLAAVQPSPHLRRHFFCEHLNSPLPFADTIHSLSHLSMSYRFCCIAPSVHGRMAPS